MTAGRFSEVDHDLLADYVGGALDGTPEQATVARLIEEDRAWGGAYAALASAVDLVRADLADWAAAPAPEMPLAVADRLAAALAGAGPAPTVGTDEAAHVGPPGGTAYDRAGALPDEAPADGRDVATTGASDGRGSTRTALPTQVTGGNRRTGGAGRPAEGSDRNTGPGRGSRRWARIAGPVALAAASVTAATLGVSHLVTAGGGSPASHAEGGRADSAAASLAAAPFRTTDPPRHSGTDYTPERFSAGTAFSRPSTALDKGRDARDTASEHGQLSAASGLDRLTRREALDACLGAISAEHAAGSVTVGLIDYASFQGQPALVVTFVDEGGADWAWVSGPECGVPGSGADTRFRTRVG